ncbi:class I SAM-dependent methyltransferase [Pedobacter sp. SL55]|uniref:class I SAM-dependent methyltransferase n=1 Tax=Pedobacter sp. SL55 TaxID=2995161 RepID=UPI002270AE61|nr:methyltransferase domain-containing protein [Pedobacter sp. SL55]WAC42041.1 methyltransferase domain-containing protein [Pedobacter sp. SL55]
MDIYGNALLDFHQTGKADILWLHNSYDEPEEMPIEVFFRGEDDMPEIELKALGLCKGKVLDVGAGVGSHALLLDQKKIDVTAIDISPIAVQIMQERGVKSPQLQDFYKVKDKYDTLLFMMNGIGLTGTLQGFEDFLERANQMINPKGQLLFDSSDISYLYEDMPMPTNQYFGEISFCYEYKKQKGSWFNWLYIDPATLQRLCKKHGWNCKIVFVDDNDQYLAQLTL